MCPYGRGIIHKPSILARESLVPQKKEKTPLTCNTVKRHARIRVRKRRKRKGTGGGKQRLGCRWGQTVRKTSTYFLAFLTLLSEKGFKAPLPLLLGKAMAFFGFCLLDFLTRSFLFAWVIEVVVADAVVLAVAAPSSTSITRKNKKQYVSL